MFRIGWERLDARLIDSKFVRRDQFNSTSGGSGTWFQVWDYMVELPTGERLVIREKSFELDLPELGGVVPVKANKKRTKAVFDLDDPRINAAERRKHQDKARKARDEARFRAKLDEPR